MAKVSPGEFSDALWGLYTLQTLQQQQQQQQQQHSAEGEAPVEAAAATTGSSSSSSSMFLTMPLMEALDRKLYKRVHELQPPQVRTMHMATAAILCNLTRLLRFLCSRTCQVSQLLPAS
jgi:hypothetical protein